MTTEHDGGAWIDVEHCAPPALAESIDAARRRVSLAWAHDVRSQIPVYDCRALAATGLEGPRRHALMSEWIEVLARGAGVIVLEGVHLFILALETGGM